MKKIAILGAGTWGVALARMLSNVGHKVTVWSAIKEEIDQLNKTHRHNNLLNTDIPESIVFDVDLEKVCVSKDIIVFAVPSVYVCDTARKAYRYINSNQIIVNVAKGIDSDKLMTMSELIESEIPHVHVVALSGPTHAEEVVKDLPTTIVAAHKYITIAEQIQKVFSTPSMRVYTNTDVKGVELCGALKNIISLAAGISAGLGYGDNTRAALITRGLVEIERLGLKMGCLHETFSGLAGMGDLIVTATSTHSRNNRCGYLIGQGYPLPAAIKKIGMVVEGIYALPAAIKLSEIYEVEMPITTAVNDIINNGKKATEIAQALMRRTFKTEIQHNIFDVNSN